MTDRTELLEAALDSWPDGIALVDGEGLVVLWNQAAEAITGYAAMEVLAHPAPEALKPLLRAGARPDGLESGGTAVGGALVQLHHRLGHEVQSMARTLPLRDGLGGRIGRITVFHPTEGLDAKAAKTRSCRPARPRWKSVCKRSSRTFCTEVRRSGFCGSWSTRRTS
jgi:PAS domain S-box-containing protein